MSLNRKADIKLVNRFKIFFQLKLISALLYTQFNHAVSTKHLTINDLHNRWNKGGEW